jgi:hypothetical protein
MELCSIGVGPASIEQSVDIIVYQQLQHKLIKLINLIKRNQSIKNMQGR